MFCTEHGPRPQQSALHGECQAVRHTGGLLCGDGSVGGLCGHDYIGRYRVGHRAAYLRKGVSRCQNRRWAVPLLAGVPALERRPDRRRYEALGGKNLLQLARQEFLLAAGNPKAILIFTAFLPQFVDPAGAVGLQFLILGALFLLLEWVAIAGYAFFGKALRHWFSRPSMRRLFNRVCAGLLGSAGAGLLLARRE